MGSSCDGQGWDDRFGDVLGIGYLASFFLQICSIPYNKDIKN
jgi:hypothetical protein